MINKSRKFRGWVVQKKHRSYLLGSVVGLRNSARVFKKYEPIISGASLERFVYVGCVHGGDRKIYQRLYDVARSKPDYVIFTGDITGSSDVEKLKSTFYRDKERGKHKNLEYFGDWAKTLTKDVRRKLLDSIEASVSRLLKATLVIKKHSKKVLVLEGNWDNPIVSGVKMIAGNDITKYFDVKKLFTEHGLPFIDRLHIFETKTTLHILLPYISLLRFEQIKPDELRTVAKKADSAKQAGKTVVMAGHAEANWKIHHLGATMPLTGERAKVISNFGRAIALFEPHEVIYPHQHARIHDEKGRLLDVDTKYLLSIDRDNKGVRLVSHLNGENIPDKDVIVTYLPFGYVAKEDFLA